MAHVVAVCLMATENRSMVEVKREVGQSCPSETSSTTSSIVATLVNKDAEDTAEAFDGKHMQSIGHSS